MLVAVPGGDDDPQSGRTSGNGRRPDRSHQQAAAAKLRRRGQRGLRSAENDGEDRSRRHRGMPESSQSGGEAIGAPAQTRAERVAFGPGENPEGRERRVRNGRRERGAENQRPGAVQQQIAAGARGRDVRAEDASRFREGTHAQVDARPEPELGHQARAARSEHARGVRLVDGEDGFVPLANLGDGSQRRDVAVH